MRNTRLWTLSLLAGALAAMPAAAQSYPTKPVRVYVGFSGGSSTDLVARMAGQKLSEIWGQSVVI
ncbi:MAG: tripartite tricarboxylate transporter substrate binding protein, partial [Elusimicrobia bacterium]|nr:tripartite tricarboxylate transporter substrate binding protein [Elusimicrobiota bacterium]